jgi:hypothetical protein
MNSPKLLEAIAELEAQRRIIDDAILHLKRAINALGGIGIVVDSVDSLPDLSRKSSPSYVNEAVQAIQREGHALHVKKIVDFIASIRSERPSRASVESSIIRHISKTRNPKLMKSAPSTYDLTVYSQRALPIAS